MIILLISHSTGKRSNVEVIVLSPVYFRYQYLSNRGLFSLVDFLQTPHPNRVAPPCGDGAVQAMALEVLHEWRLCRTVEAFGAWLSEGAPSEDRA